MVRASLNWPWLVAAALVVVTGLQLCSGALVTTYDAAMAVPDWPSTYGHNMFLFPLREWLGGPFDLMLEHGHRLWGTVVGLLTLVLAAVCWTAPVKPVVRSLAVAAVALVVLQGVVGGFRVLLDSQTVAKVHACAGPLFFAVAVAITALARHPRDSITAASPLAVRSSVGLVAAAYLQLVAGAQLRHLDAAVDPRTFHGLVALHLTGAVAVLALGATAVAATRATGRGGAWLWSRAILFLVGCQIVLGGGAWVAKYGLPSALLPEAWRFSAPLVARSGTGAAIVTAHAVLGMLMLGAAVALAIASGALGRAAVASAARGRAGTEAFA